MMPKLPRLDRRTFLRGLGVACALPYLEAMGGGRPGGDPTPARRACFVYFPNGCSLPERDDEANRAWRWFPDGEGESFRLTRVLDPLEPFRDDLAIYGGLSHPNSRELLGHLAGDTWLTGGDLRGGHYRNSISLDQRIARKLGADTRFASFVLSTDGGVGYKSRVSTLSFDANGSPIPAEHHHRRIFERYFVPGGGSTTQERRKSLQRGRKVVDLVMAESRRLSQRLGQRDRHKLDEYLTSLSAVEAQIQRNEAWLDTPLPEFDASDLNLGPDPEIDPVAHVRTMFDLMLLGFEIDLTRVMSFQLAREDGMGFGDAWPRIAIGVNKGHHTISHDTHDGHFDEWGAFDRWYTEQFAYFVGRLRESEDAHGPLLDRTLVLYGSSCSTTHNARNYPLALVGGGALGVSSGRYAHYSKSALLNQGADPGVRALLEQPGETFSEDDVPVGALYLGMLHALGVEAEDFAGSTEVLPGFFA